MVTDDSQAPDQGRRKHYGEFYELSRTEDAPIGVVVGNCQAESLRQTLPDSVAWIRIPPVHELTAYDLPYLERLLDRTDALVSQPVRDDYHGMPLGTRQLFARLRPGSVSAVMPVIRFAGLYPTHVIVRPPSDPSLNPPLVGYHDLHTMAEAAGTPLPELTVAASLAIAELSQHELRSREQKHNAVAISDLFTTPNFELMRTINHPGNPLWEVLAARVADRLGISGAPIDVGRPLLNAVHAPRQQVVIDAWGVDAAATTDWIIDGTAISDAELRRLHLAWYAEHPDVLAAGLQRHERAIGVLAG